MASYTVNAPQLYNRLKTGCHLHIIGDSFAAPFENRVGPGGMTMTFPSEVFNMSGTGFEERTDYDGVFVNPHSVLAGSTYAETDQHAAAVVLNTQFPTTITKGVAHCRRSEWDFTSDVGDNIFLEAYLLRGGGSTTKGLDLLPDNAWTVGEDNIWRLIYYAHENGPTDIRMDATTFDTPPTALTVDMSMPVGQEAMKYVEFTGGRADALTYTGQFGPRWDTNVGVNTLGWQVSLVGGVMHNPNIQNGVIISGSAFGGASFTEFTDPARLPGFVPDDNLAKYCEIMQLDTVVIWFADHDVDPNLSTRVEDIGVRYETAINTARGQDSSIRAPMIVVVVTPENDATDANRSTQATQLEALCISKGWTMVNVYQAMKDRHGLKSTWVGDEALASITTVGTTVTAVSGAPFQKEDSGRMLSHSSGERQIVEYNSSTEVIIDSAFPSDLTTDTGVTMVSNFMGVGDTVHMSRAGAHEFCSMFWAAIIDEGASDNFKQGLAAAYELKEDSGLRPDLSGNGLDLTEFGGVTQTTGVPGIGVPANAFDGVVNTRLELDSTAFDIPIHGAYSLSVWVNATTFASKVIAARDTFITDGWSLQTVVPRLIKVVHNHGSTDSWAFRQTFAVLNNAQWNHIVVVWQKGSALTIYINGVPKPFFFPLSPSVSVNAFQIGASKSATNFDGKIAQFLRWNRALSGQEALSLYNGGDGLSMTSFLGVQGLRVLIR